MQKLKERLTDVHGSRFNVLCKFFGDIKPFSELENVKKGLGHWPEHALTMIGMDGLDNIEWVVNEIVKNKTDGDILEAGVWRGGSTIFIKKLLQSHSSDKKLYVCDSFEGLPRPEGRYNVPEDIYDTHHEKNSYLGVGLDNVVQNFKDYDALDDRVIFKKGWFKDTLKDNTIGDLSLLRMDGDMYSSTMDILYNLYDKVVPDGYIIIDDYGLDCCRKAVIDFFREKKIDIANIIIKVNHSIAYVQKKKLVPIVS